MAHSQKQPNNNRLAPSRSKQQGVYAIMFVALLGTILAVVVVLGVGINRLYSEHRDLQNQANAAAIAAANATQACGSLDGENFNDLDGVVSKLKGDKTLSNGVELVKDQSSFGYLKTNTNNLYAFTPVTDIKESNAVHVVLSREAEYSRILPGWFKDNTFTMSAQATAKNEVVGTFTTAGSTAVVGGSDTVLGNVMTALLAQNSLDPTSLNSLKNTFVNVGDLLGALKSTVGGGDVLDAPLSDLAEALGSTLGNTAGQGTFLNNLAGSIDTVMGSVGVDSKLKVKDVLNVVGDASVPENAELPVYGLVSSLVLALGKKVIDVPLPTNVDLGVANVGVKLQVGHPPGFVVGPARKDTDGNWMVQFKPADISLGLRTEVNLPLVLVALKGNLNLVVNTGGGEGQIESASCRTGLGNDVVLEGTAHSNLATVMTGTLEHGQASAGLTVALLAGVASVEVPIDIIKAELGNSNEQTLKFEQNLNDIKSVTKVVPSNANSPSLAITDNDIDLDVAPKLCTVLAPIVPCITIPVGDILSPLLSTVINPLLQGLGPILSGLGLQLGQMEVTLLGAEQVPATLVPGKITIVAAKKGNDDNGT